MTKTKRDPRRSGLILVVAVAGALLLPAILFGSVMLFHHPYRRGRPSAVLDIESGRPFELRYVSNGAPQRIWLDLECERCSLPAEGAMRARAGGREIASFEVSAGEDSLGSRKSLEEQLIGDLPEQPRGTEVVVRGTLAVATERGLFSNEPRTDVPAPAVRVLRVTIAP